MPEIPLKPGSNDLVIIDSDTIAFKNWKVRIEDITGLAFGSKSTTGYVSNSGAHVSVHTASSCYKIATIHFGVLGLLEGKDNMHQIMDAVRQAVGPFLVRNILTYIFDQGTPVDIARFTLDHSGLAYRGITGTTKIPWNFKPSFRTTTKTRWLTGGTIHGVQEVVYFNPQTGKNAALGTVTSADINGCFLPNILEIISSQFKS